MIELNAKKLSAAQIVPTVKLRLRSTPRSSSGGSGVVRCAVSDSSTDCRTATVYAFARRTCRTTNHTMPHSPTSIAPHTIGFDGAYDSMFVNPNIRPPKPSTDMATEKKSALAWSSVVPKLRSPKMASSRQNTPIIVSVKKIERQPKLSVWKPPKVGPSAGATLMAMPTAPMAMPRRDNG